MNLFCQATVLFRILWLRSLDGQQISHRIYLKFLNMIFLAIYMYYYLVKKTNKFASFKYVLYLYTELFVSGR